MSAKVAEAQVVAATPMAAVAADIQVFSISMVHRSYLLVAVAVATD